MTSFSVRIVHAGACGRLPYLEARQGLGANDLECMEGSDVDCITAERRGEAKEHCEKLHTPCGTWMGHTPRVRAG